MIFIVTLVLEVLIAIYIHDDFIRPYIGDILVIIVIYSFVRIFIPNRFRFMPFFVFIFASGVEILQYFNIAKLLGVSDNLIARTVIGSTFDVKDIICYAVGSLVIFLIQKYIELRK